MTTFGRSLVINSLSAVNSSYDAIEMVHDPDRSAESYTEPGG